MRGTSWKIEGGEEGFWRTESLQDREDSQRHGDLRSPGDGKTFVLVSQKHQFGLSLLVDIPWDGGLCRASGVELRSIVEALNWKCVLN